MVIPCKMENQIWWDELCGGKEVASEEQRADVIIECFLEEGCKHHSSGPRNSYAVRECLEENLAGRKMSKES